MKNCVVLVCHGNGYGDQYISLMTSYNFKKDLELMGYNVKMGYIVWHNYFNNSIPMDVLFDYSLFDTEVCFVKQPPDFRDKVHPLLKGLEEYKKEGHNCVLFGEPNDRELMEYSPSKLLANNSKLEYGTLNCNNFWIGKSFLQKEILQMVDDKISNASLGTDFHVCHIRCEDNLAHYNFSELMDFSPFWRNKIQYVEEHMILKNLDKKIMVCSQNAAIASYFQNKYSNIYCNEFTHKELGRHNSYWYEEIADGDYIQHSKEILIEMAMFYKARKISTHNTFPSNFITYGIVHNIHHSNPELSGESLFL